MFINGFFKCLKIKSLTYWWSFRSCPGREKEPELERVWRAAELTPAAKKQEAEEKEEEEEELCVSWEEGIRRCTQQFFCLLKYGTLPRKFHLTRYTLNSSTTATSGLNSYLLNKLTWKNCELLMNMRRVFLVFFFLGCRAVNSNWFYHSAATCRSPLAHHGNSLSHLIRYLIHNKSILISFKFGGRRRGAALCLGGSLLFALPPPIILSCFQPPVICTPDIS